MSEGDWLFAVGPIDAAGAREFRDRLRAQLGGSQEVHLIDHRVRFSGAWDVDSIEAVIPVLEAGLRAETLPVEVRHIAMGFLSDMRTWLEREYDPTLDPVAEP